MNHLATWINTPFAQALGWTLAHFVWEGALLALMLAATLRLFRGLPSRRRYALACATLAAMPVAFAVTLAVMLPAPPAQAATPAGLAPVMELAVQAAVAAPAGLTPVRLQDLLPWLAPFWIAGVVFFYARGIAGWVAVERLRRRGVCASPPHWQRRLDELAARLRLTRPVVLLESCFTDTPVLIGYLRPVVLLPLGCLTGLSAGQLECILLHELAHVRRHDYLVNLLQGVVEGLLFYHPAVWWVSRAVRAERENCCDDAVVEIVGDARAYAATLAALERQRSLAPEAALAATGGNLIERIRRLTMEPRGAHTSAAPAVSAGILLVLFAAALAAWPAKTPSERRPQAARPVAGAALAVAPIPQEQPAAPPVTMRAPYRKWLLEDVAYIITNEERAAFQRLQSDAEIETFIESFWLRRDPTPGTVENEFKEEHYRRIAYANQHYASATPGWKTDRGRIYITYGPPDEIEERSQSTPKSQVWRYRLIEGIGKDIAVEFVDSSGDGEYRMSADPGFRQARADQAARVFTAPEGPAVSVTVAGRHHPAGQPGTIGVGDVLSLGFYTGDDPASVVVRSQNLISVEQETNAKITELDALLKKYQPGFLEVRVVEEQLRALEERRNALERFRPETGQQGMALQALPNQQAAQQLAVLRHEEGNISAQIEASVQRVKVKRERARGLARELRLNDLQQAIALAQGEYQRMGGEGANNSTAQSAKAKMEAAQASLAQFADANTARLPDGFSGVAALVEASGLNDQINQEMQRQRTLEANLNTNRSLQSHVEANLQATVLAPRQADSRVTVRSDGRISVDYAGDVKAAGLTPAELNAVLAQALSGSPIQQPPAVRILELVTIQVPLDASVNWYHVFGQVSTASRKMVQTFENDVPGQPALAHVIPLAAGSYHLLVTVKNQATGASARSSELDFTVD